MTSTSSDFQRAVNFARQWQALPQNRRARLARDMPVATIQAAALGHPDFTVRRFCLFLLDHYASDASWEVFRRALRDPVPAVRAGALHGIACERCRVQALPVAGVVGDLVAIMGADPNPEVRYKTVAALARFLERDGRAGEAIARAAADDPDPAIRHVAQRVGTGDPGVQPRKATLRDLRRNQRGLRRSGTQ